ncbi:CD48 antigen-like [Rhinoraja longicauda]
MWEFSLRSVLCLFWASLFARCLAGTGAAAGTVTGARGHSVFLPAGNTVAQSDVEEVVWRRTSFTFKIAKYSNRNIEYKNSNYTGRVTLHSGNFSLEIRDLRREDTGEYVVTVETSSTGETHARVRLEVYEPVSGTKIRPQNITEICNFTLTCSVTSGDPTSFKWWKGEEALGNDSTHHLRGHGETVEVHHTAEVGDVVYRCEARNPASKNTAEIQLKDVCKQTTSGFGALSSVWIIVIVIVIVLILIAIIAVIMIGMNYHSTHGAWRGNAAGGDVPADPGPIETIYAQVEQPQNRPAKRQPPEGNEKVQSQEETIEILSTLYDTVQFPGTSGIGSPGATGKSLHCEPGDVHPPPQPGDH